MPGPLPEPNHIRRHAPTIPTTELPAGGRRGPAPKVPSWVRLGAAGRAWWRSAWSTPQACGWGTGTGFEPIVARRASLEDDLAALELVEGVDLDAAVGAYDHARELAWVIRRVMALVTGRLQIMREMRELDDRLGLSPKGLAHLRWRVVDDVVEDQAVVADEVVADLSQRRARLTNAS